MLTEMVNVTKSKALGVPAFLGGAGSSSFLPWLPAPQRWLFRKGTARHRHGTARARHGTAGQRSRGSGTLRSAGGALSVPTHQDSFRRSCQVSRGFPRRGA